MLARAIREYTRRRIERRTLAQLPAELRGEFARAFVRSISYPLTDMALTSMRWRLARLLHVPVPEPLTLADVELAYRQPAEVKAIISTAKVR